MSIIANITDRQAIKIILCLGLVAIVVIGLIAWIFSAVIGGKEYDEMIDEKHNKKVVKHDMGN
jgi:hypothetical protein